MSSKNTRTWSTHDQLEYDSHWPLSDILRVWSHCFNEAHSHFYSLLLIRISFPSKPVCRMWTLRKQNKKSQKSISAQRLLASLPAHKTNPPKSKVKSKRQNQVRTFFLKQKHDKNHWVIYPPWLLKITHSVTLNSGRQTVTEFTSLSTKPTQASTLGPYTINASIFVSLAHKRDILPSSVTPAIQVILF